MGEIIYFKCPLNRDFGVAFDQLVFLIGHDKAMDFAETWVKMSKDLASKRRMALNVLFETIIKLTADTSHLTYKFLETSKKYNSSIY